MSTGMQWLQAMLGEPGQEIHVNYISAICICAIVLSRLHPKYHARAAPAPADSQRGTSSRKHLKHLADAPGTSARAAAACHVPDQSETGPPNLAILAQASFCCGAKTSDQNRPPKHVQASFTSSAVNLMVNDERRMRTFPFARMMKNTRDVPRTPGSKHARGAQDDRIPNTRNAANDGASHLGANLAFILEPTSLDEDIAASAVSNGMQRAGEVLEAARAAAAADLRKVSTTPDSPDARCMPDRSETGPLKLAILAQAPFSRSAKSRPPSQLASIAVSAAAPLI